MATPRWRFALQDKNGGALCPLTGATERVFRKLRNEGPSFEFAVDLEHPNAYKLLDYLDTGVPIIRGWRKEPAGTVCRYSGQVNALDEEAGEEATVKVASSPLAQLATRHTGEIKDFPFIDAGEVVRQLVVDANTEGATGIVMGTVQATANRDLTLEHKNVMEQVRELAELDPGFDYDVAPIAAGANVGTLSVYASLGVDRPGAQFGHGPGTRRNVQRVQRLEKPPVNRVRVLGDEGVYMTASLTDSIAKYGVWFEFESISDAIEADILLARANERLEGAWQRTTAFTPEPERAPLPLVDYDVGDRVRLQVRRGALRLSASPRVDGIEIRIDDEGNEEAHELTIPEV